MSSGTGVHRRLLLGATRRRWMWRCSSSFYEARRARYDAPLRVEENCTEVEVEGFGVEKYHGHAMESVEN